MTDTTSFERAVVLCADLIARGMPAEDVLPDPCGPASDYANCLETLEESVQALRDVRGIARYKLTGALPS